MTPETMLRTAIPALALFAGCGGTITLTNHTATVGSGGNVALMAEKKGSVDEIHWEVVKSDPEDCRGTVVTDPAVPTMATFLAPEGCGGNNIVELTAKAGLRPVSQLVEVQITPPTPSAVAANEPASTEVPSAGVESRDALRLVPAFSSETYIAFQEQGFRASFEELNGRIGVRLAAPNSSGFGGVCIISSHDEDLRSASTMYVTLQSEGPHQNIEIKLEKFNWQEHNGHRIVYDGALGTDKLTTLPIDISGEARDLMANLRKVCFSTSSYKIHGAPPVHQLYVHGVRFE
ncbi:MAG: hypothetical protein ABIO70_27045 [Pseudomonadota bacterium]